MICKELLHENLGVSNGNLTFAGYDTVELAKKYDDEKTYGFVNGVLNAVAEALSRK